MNLLSIQTILQNHDEHSLNKLRLPRIKVVIFQVCLYLYPYLKRIYSISNIKCWILYRLQTSIIKSSPMYDKQDQFVQATMAMQKLIAKSKDHKSTALKSYIVALYSADDQNPLRFSGKIGMLQLDFDRGVKYHFLRMYDLQTLELLLELQLFYGFGQNYRKSQKNTLYIFDFFADGIIGFQFRNEKDASEMAAKIKAVSPKSQQLKKLLQERRQKQEKQKKQSSFFGKLKNKFGSIIHTEEVHEQSVVLKVQKQKSIAMNLETGEFDCSNVPPQWEEILSRAGLKKEDLKDKQVAKLVFEQTILHQAKKAAEENANQVKKQHLKMIQQTAQDDDHYTTQQHFEKQQKTGSSSPGSQSIPSIPKLTLPPPVIGEASQLVRKSTNRADLMTEIRNNNLKLKPVKTTSKGVEIDASSMNKQQRNDLAEHIRMKLQRRKLALNRRKASDQQED